MCSTPKGSGKSSYQPVRIDEGLDYAAYSQMLRRASTHYEQRQKEKQRPTPAQQPPENPLD